MTTTKNAEALEIETLRDHHVAALNAGQADVWAACFTSDGVQMPPNVAANVGAQAIQGWSRGFLSMFDCQFALSVDEMQVNGEWAFERGGYTIHLTPKGGQGPAMDDEGKYITIYQHQPDGSWKMARDIWNSDVLLPGAS